ncbi:MAG: type VI secretion system ATPase TssH, partial [Clostridium sp.]
PYLLQNNSQEGISEDVREQVMGEMRNRFKPEFLNRVDDIIMFKPLSEEGIKKIIDIFMEDVKRRLKDKNIFLTLSEEGKEVLAREGYDPIYGARPLKRYIQNTLENKLAKMIIRGELTYGDRAVVKAQDDEIIIEIEK